MASSCCLRLCVLIATFGFSTAKSQSAKNPAALEKVITLLKDLQTQVKQEGEEEAQTYATFACSCKDLTAELSTSISSEQTQKESLIAQIGVATASRTDLDTTMEELVAAISTLEKEQVAADAECAARREWHRGVYEDLTGAVNAIRAAVKTLKASKTVSAVQLKAVLDASRPALVMADALGLLAIDLKGVPQRAASLFLQNGQAPDDYQFHSDDIITTLEKLLEDFVSELTTSDNEAVQEEQACNLAKQQRQSEIKTKQTELDDSQAAKATKTTEIQTGSQQLSTSESSLRSIQEYLRNVSADCNKKAEAWDARKEVRTNEISALANVIAILENTLGKTSDTTLAQRSLGIRRVVNVLQNKASMEAIEAEAEHLDSLAQERQPVLLQRSLRRAKPKSSFVAAVTLLRKRATALKSAELLRLAEAAAADSGSSEDPFVKVKAMIQALIERLLKQAAEEGDQHSWCEQVTKEEERKRDTAATDIREGNAALAEAIATSASQAEALEKLTTETATLTAAKEEAEVLRANETAENDKVVAEAEEGHEAVQAATEILTKHYGAAVDDISGILGLLQVIESDFQRTITETKEAEAEAAAEHKEFFAATDATLAKIEEVVKAHTSYKAESDAKVLSLKTKLSSAVDMLKASVGELLSLQPSCVHASMTFEDRVAVRAEEIEALKQALCILEGTSTDCI